MRTKIHLMRLLPSLTALFLLSVPLSAVERSASISGVVKTSLGGPAVGAMVKLRNKDLGFAVSVISRDGGNYTALDLPPGNYVARAEGGGFQSDSDATVQLLSNGKTTINLTLNIRMSLGDVLTSSQAAMLMPEGPGKERVVAECGVCHKDGLYKLLSRRWARDQWAEAIHKMEINFFNYAHPLHLTDTDRALILDYLTKSFGPDKPPLDANKVAGDIWIKGASAKSVVTVWNLPSGARPHDVAVDQQGIGWVAESGLGYIGRLDPQTLTYTRISVPDGEIHPDRKNSSSAHSVVFDPQGDLWLSDHRRGRLLRYVVKTGKFDIYPYPELKEPPGPNTIRIHPNGMVYLTEDSTDLILRLNPATKQFTQIPVPFAARGKGRAHPYGMAIDKDGWIWFAEYSASKMGRLDAKTGEITEYATPTPRANPRRMTTDSQGNVWAGEFAVGKVLSVDYRTAKITEYATPSKYSGPYTVDVDRKRNLIWVMENLADQIARLDPRTDTWVEYPLPSHYISVRRIEADPSRPNRVWYAGQNNDTVGYLDVLE